MDGSTFLLRRNVLPSMQGAINRAPTQVGAINHAPTYGVDAGPGAG